MFGVIQSQNLISTESARHFRILTRVQVVLQMFSLYCFLATIIRTLCLSELTDLSFMAYPIVVIQHFITALLLIDTAKLNFWQDFFKQ